MPYASVYTWIKMNAAKQTFTSLDLTNVLDMLAFVEVGSEITVIFADDGSEETYTIEEMCETSFSVGFESANEIGFVFLTNRDQNYFLRTRHGFASRKVAEMLVTV